MMRGAIVGAGRMGSMHARALVDVDGVLLVGVVDVDEERRRTLAARHGVRSYGTVAELFEVDGPDFVVVAAPPGAHYEIASDLLRRRTHVLVEKPMASTVDQARELVDLATRTERSLGVGHVERFNPAIRELARRIAAGELGAVRRLHARRLSTRAPVLADVGVAMDLGIHEIDAIQDVVGSPVTHVRAEARRVRHAEHEDELDATLDLANGVVATIETRWTASVPVRQLAVETEHGAFRVDYADRSLSVSCIDGTYDAWARGTPVEPARVRALQVPSRDPLRAQLASFVDACARRAEPEVSGTDGLRAVALADLCLASARIGRSLQVTDRTFGSTPRGRS